MDKSKELTPEILSSRIHGMITENTIVPGTHYMVISESEWNILIFSVAYNPNIPNLPHIQEYGFRGHIHGLFILVSDDVPVMTIKPIEVINPLPFGE